MSQSNDTAHSAAVKVTRIGVGRSHRVDDLVAVEDPLEIRLGETPLAVSMRTPGHDADLVRGFLLTESILLDPAEIRGIERLDDSRVL